jgi:cation-transporting ATPase 13A3/4/5
VLAFLGVVQSAISLYLDFSAGATVGIAIINALELLTIIIPPALPTALAAGISLAMNRLEK